MKSQITFSAAVTATLMTACCKAVEVHDPEEIQPQEMAELLVNIPLETQTKASGTGSEADEKTLSSVQVFVFNASGVLEAYKTGTTGSLDLSCTKGKKTVAALVNAPEAGGVKTLEELRGMTTLLSDNGRKAFVMYGQTAVSVNAASIAVTIEVHRFAAKIVIRKITNRMELPQYQSSPIEVKSLYLINVAGDALLSKFSGPSLWLNKGVNEASNDCLYYEKTTSLPIAFGSSDAAAHHFYCYPNPVSADSSSAEWVPRHTRLIVEAGIGGNVYYYPVTLPVINGNTVYTINELTITRLGAATPDVDSVIGSASFRITVTPWKNETVQSVTI